MIFPIGFCIPESKIITEVCVKERVYSAIIPGKPETYIYNTEKDYYEAYATSIFGLTKKKSGWDCMRHYEILANGCIPWFEYLEDCPPHTMIHFPKELILQTMHSANELTAEKVIEVSKELLDYTRTHLTTKAMASYVLRTSGNFGAKSILYLSQCISPDYLRELLLHGFKELLGEQCHDSPRIPFLYTDYNEEKVEKLYGKGMTYSRLLAPEFHDSAKDATLIQDIENHVYDCIVYGSVHRGTPLWNKVVKVYKPNEIILLCGEDLHECNLQPHFGEFGKNKGFNLFVREL